MLHSTKFHLKSKIIRFIYFRHEHLKEQMTYVKTKKKKRRNSKISKKVALPKLQRKILIHLSENDPMTINKTATSLNAHPKASSNAFKSLQSLKLITKVGSKVYHNNEYSLFWATEDGAVLALCEGAEQKRVLKRAFKIYPDNRNLHFALEIMPIFGLDAFKLVCSAFAKKGKLEDSDKAQIYATQMQHKFTPDEEAQFSDVLNRYPEQKKPFVDAFSKMNIGMEKLLKQLETSEEKE
jgi:DNA-binding MarR family transcriptional regulator